MQTRAWLCFMGGDETTMSQMSSTNTRTFTTFAGQMEPRLRRAFVAALGADLAPDAMAEAWTYAWQHWERIEQMANPAGYVYRIGRTRASRLRPRSHVRLPHVTAIEMPWIEPELPEALSRLSERQRVAVVLVHCFEYTHAEAAEVLGVSRSTLQKHVDRGMGKLRRTLGVNQ